MMDYFYQGQEEQYQFFRFPKKLITDSEYSELSMDAKVLYGLMLDRIGMSRNNQWLDNKGRIYIIYTVHQIEMDLNCGYNKAINTKKELENIGLIQIAKRGQGKPDLIYVMNFMSADGGDTVNQTEKNHKSNFDIYKTNIKTFGDENTRDCKKQHQDICSKNPNHTELNNTYGDKVVHPPDAENQYDLIMRIWNSTSGVTPIRNIAPGTERSKMLDKCIQCFGVQTLIEAIAKIPQSEYLCRSQTQFNWFFRPENLVKVIEGTYDRSFKNSGKKTSNSFKNFEERTYDYDALAKRFF